MNWQAHTQGEGGSGGSKDPPLAYEFRLRSNFYIYTESEL